MGRDNKQYKRRNFSEETYRVTEINYHILQGARLKTVTCCEAENSNFSDKV
jgi:hypothetical protein